MDTYEYVSASASVCAISWIPVLCIYMYIHIYTYTFQCMYVNICIYMNMLPHRLRCAISTRNSWIYAYYIYIYIYLYNLYK